MDDPRVDRAVAVDAAGHPGRAAELRQTYSRLLEALDRLPAPMRTSVVLVALQGFSHAEAAVVQKCSEGTVAWRIHEARSRLRKALERRGLPRSAQSAFQHGEDGPDLARLLLEWEIPTGLLPS